MPYHGAAYMYSRLSLIISPQEGCGGWVPRPRKLRLASSRMARDTPMGIWTSTGESTFGRMVRKTIRASRAPAATDASTYSIARCVSTPARAIRANCGRPTIAIATPAFTDPGPTAATSAIASSTGGIARSVSTVRIAAASTAPPLKPVQRPSGTPHTAATAVDPTPIASAIRAPYKRRLRMSRPNWSVPARWLHDGSASTASLLMSVGPYRARSGAAAAVAAIAIRKTAPASGTRARRAARARRGACLPARPLADTVIGAPGTRRPSLIPHPRIEQAVERVGAEIDHDERRDADENHRLRDQIVARQDRAPQHAAEPRNRKHGLRDHGAADEKPGLNAEHRDDRNERVAERVPPHHRAAWQALRARRAHVVVRQHVAERRLHEARHHRADAEAERDARQHEAARPPGRALREADEPRGRQPFQDHAEVPRQDRPEPEHRHGQGPSVVPAQRGRERRPRPRGREHARGKRDQHDHGERPQRELQRQRQGAPDELGHRRAVDERMPQIAVRDPDDPPPVLQRERPVQAEIRPQGAQLVGGAAVPENDLRRVPRQRGHHGKDQHGREKQGERSLDAPPRQVASQPAGRHGPRLRPLERGERLADPPGDLA